MLARPHRRRLRAVRPPDHLFAVECGRAVHLRCLMAWWWGVALVAAVAWPGRLIGPLDGAPFDTAAKVLAFAFVLPVLWWFHPAFLRTVAARTLVALLLGWKIATWMAVSQTGWCGRSSSRTHRRADWLWADATLGRATLVGREAARLFRDRRAGLPPDDELPGMVHQHSVWLRSRSRHWRRGESSGREPAAAQW